MGVARDIAIIVVAVESIVMGILMAILVIQVIRLVNLLRNEVLPIIRSTQETVGTVRGTTAFVSDHLVQPVVSVASYTAGVRRVLNAVLGVAPHKGKS